VVLVLNNVNYAHSATANFLNDHVQLYLVSDFVNLMHFGALRELYRPLGMSSQSIHRCLSVPAERSVQQNFMLGRNICGRPAKCKRFLKKIGT
jgi:hypothetical protein